MIHYPKFFMGLSELFKPLSPTLSQWLKQSGSDKTYREFFASNIFFSALLFLVLLTIIEVFLVIIKAYRYMLPFALFIFILAIVGFFTRTYRLKLKTQYRIRNIESNLLSVLRDMHVQLDSGIPLFQVMVNVAEGNYGELSLIFKKGVQKLSSGKDQDRVFSEMIEETPSEYFKLAMIQITNSQKSGADVSAALENIINSISAEQINQIENYGNRVLRPFSMFYMVVVLVIPSLSIVFLVAMLSFVSTQTQISKVAFFGLETVVFILQIITRKEIILV